MNYFPSHHPSLLAVALTMVATRNSSKKTGEGSNTTPETYRNGNAAKGKGSEQRSSKGSPTAKETPIDEGTRVFASSGNSTGKGSASPPKDDLNFDLNEGPDQSTISGSNSKRKFKRSSLTPATYSPTTKGGEGSEQGKSREARRNRREDLRSKSTGLGISISNDRTLVVPPNKKIVFDDEVEAETPREREVENETAMIVDAEDDDAVEEVQTDIARIQAQKQRDEERESALEALKTKKRKRKSKSLEKSKPQIDDNELDDEFFEQLDAEREQTRMTGIVSAEPTKQQRGRHTTFVANGDEVDGPVKAGHNIEVVVLKDQGQLSASVGTFVASEAAQLFSRNRLNDGSDAVSAKQLHKAKKAGRKAVDNTTWKRSKKMNRLLLPGVQSVRKSGKGFAAAHFVGRM
jgi:hypothetical protein